MKAIFHDEKAVRKHLEALRWPNGPVCPHCGFVGKIGKVEGKKKSHRDGLYYCNGCEGTFTVTVGTVFERSKIPLHKWVHAFYLYSSNKKGFSAHQLHRTLDITYKSAWFMAHRVRHAMSSAGMNKPMGGKGSIIEADETYFGDNDTIKKRTRRGKASLGSKRMVLSLVEGGGEVRSFHVDRRKKMEVARIVAENVDKEARLFTDEAMMYKAVGKEFTSHETVAHKVKEWARGDVHTNTIEGYFGIFKRGMKGIYQHCGENHLHRYLAEFDFRYSNRKVTDGERADIALKGAEGKRLMYQDTAQS